jgi:hypothetical protein
MRLARRRITRGHRRAADTGTQTATGGDDEPARDEKRAENHDAAGCAGVHHRLRPGDYIFVRR